MGPAIAMVVCLTLWPVLWWLLKSGRPSVQVGRLAVGRFFLVVLVLLGVVISVLGVQQFIRELGPSWQAAMGQGTRGTFTADHTYVTGARSRERQWLGTFVSEDGTIVRENVALDGPPAGMSLNSPVPALDTGVGRAVYGDRSAVDVVRNIGQMIIVLLVWTAGVWLFVRWLRQRGKDAEPARPPPEESDSRTVNGSGPYQPAGAH